MAKKNILPEYKEDFGHEVEEVVMDILEKRGIIVEAIEKGSKIEDIRKKVDFWLKLKGVERPIGIQYTCTDNDDIIERKIKQLKDRNWQAEKELPGAIGWSGKTDIVLIRGNKQKIARYYNESKEKKVSPAEVAGDEFVRGFFEQMLRQLNIFSPVKAKIIVDVFQKELISQQQKRGRK